MNEIYERICKIAKENGMTVTFLCEKTTGSKGNLQTWKKGIIRSDYLIKIANLLNCSVDYVLGRTAQTTQINSNNTINGNNNIIGNNTNISDGKRELINFYDNFDVIKQAKLLAYASELAKE